jgi:uncharacterized integral membrane protein (TIGR00698 family)
MLPNSVPTASDPIVDRPTLLASVSTTLPGLALCGSIAVGAIILHGVPFFALFSPLIVAVIGGTALKGFNLVPRSSHAGLAFAARPLLRFAVVLLGFQLTWYQIQEVGLVGTTIVVLSLTITLIATTALGRLLKIDRKLVQLIAVGTSICGASAIVAANSVTRGSDEDVAYALACVTFCGTVAMFVLPLMIPIAHIDSYRYGLWSGAAIHEVGQVVGAAFQGGQAAGEFGVIAKLTRVTLLAPVIFALAFVNQRNDRDSGNSNIQSSVRFPTFILLFLGVVTLNSIATIPAEAKSVIATVSTILLTAALAAIGLSADAGRLRERGFKPLVLSLAASVFIAAISFGLLKILT